MVRLGRFLLLLVFIAYPIVLHTFILKEDVGTPQLLFVLVPLLAIVFWWLLGLIGRGWWPLVVGLFLGTLYYAVDGDHGRVSLLAVNGLSHATFNLFLLWLFGRTLFRGRVPLITQIARRINGQLELDIIGYTRQVTIAWCLFFALQVMTSLLLYILTSPAAWSFFINVLNLPLLILMFSVEYAYRTARFPNHPKASIAKVFKVYSEDFAVSRKADSKR